MIVFSQHIPAFVDGVTPVVAVVFNQDELLALPCVANWRTEEFSRYSLADGMFLMAEMKDGKFWVIGFIKRGADQLTLPVWERKP